MVPTALPAEASEHDPHHEHQERYHVHCLIVARQTLSWRPIQPVLSRAVRHQPRSSTAQVSTARPEAEPSWRGTVARSLANHTPTATTLRLRRRQLLDLRAGTRRSI